MHIGTVPILNSHNPSFIGRFYSTCAQNVDVELVIVFHKYDSKINKFITSQNGRPFSEALFESFSEMFHRCISLETSWKADVIGAFSSVKLL